MSGWDGWMDLRAGEGIEHLSQLLLHISYRRYALKCNNMFDIITGFVRFAQTDFHFSHPYVRAELGVIYFCMLNLTAFIFEVRSRQRGHRISEVSTIFCSNTFISNV